MGCNDYRYGIVVWLTEVFADQAKQLYEGDEVGDLEHLLHKALDTSELQLVEAEDVT